MILALWIVPLVTLVIFLLFYLRDPRRIINGFLFNIFAVITSGICILAAITSDIWIFRLLAIIPVILIFLVLLFGGFALAILLLINGRILIKKEGRKFSNYLALILGLCILAYIVVTFIQPVNSTPSWVQVLYSGITLLLFYFFIDVSSFLSAYFLYQFNRPKLNQNFIIVLGSRVIGTRVPPLLAKRIDKAIEFYYCQAAVTTPPKIIFSGGKGSDEQVSEAEAMQAYAVDKEIPIEDTIQENRSTNTYENMLFSKQIMDDLSGGSRYNSIFTTNNFHLFRAGMYARLAGLPSQGIGAKTALYYWPNAMIREYVAVVVMNKKRHSIVSGILLGIPVIVLIFSFFVR